MDNVNEKSSYVTYDGRTVVDLKALLRKPKVLRTLERLATSTHRSYPAGHIAIVRRLKPEE